MRKCGLQPQRSLHWKPCTHKGISRARSIRRRCRVLLRATSASRERLQITEIFSKNINEEGVQEILAWLARGDDSPSFSLAFDRGTNRLTDVLQRLKDSKELNELLRSSSTESKTSKNFLVSLMHKVYTKVVRRERQSFAEAFDRAALEARVSKHWHQQLRYATMGPLNPANPDERFLSVNYFGLPGEDAASVFESCFGIPLPNFNKKSNHQYVKSLMTLAAKKDRKYYGLANMDLPEPFTPYQAYAMVQLAVEDGVLDPKDFKAKAWTLPSAARTASQKLRTRKKMVPGVVNKSKKGFGKAKEVPRVETPRRMRFSEEEIDGNEAILFALEFIETYSDLPVQLWPHYNELENAAMVSQSLKKGMFGFDSRYTFSHAASDDFVDVVLGHNQAPPGCWEPGMAAKGLIPNLQDVRLRLNRAYSSKYCDIYWSVMGLPEEKKRQWISLDFVAKIPGCAMRAVHWLACLGQLGDKMEAEGHQWELWQDLRRSCDISTLWLLEGRIAAQDKKELVDPESGYRIRFVKDNPITLDVVKPEPQESAAPATEPEQLVEAEQPTASSNGVLTDEDIRLLGQEELLKRLQSVGGAEEPTQIGEDGLNVNGKHSGLLDGEPQSVPGPVLSGKEESPSKEAEETSSSADASEQAPPEDVAASSQAVRELEVAVEMVEAAVQELDSDIKAAGEREGLRKEQGHEEAAGSNTPEASSVEADQLTSSSPLAANTQSLQEQDQPALPHHTEQEEESAQALSIDSLLQASETLRDADASPPNLLEEPILAEPGGVHSEHILSSSLREAARIGETISPEPSTSDSDGVKKEVELAGWKNMLSNRQLHSKTWLHREPQYSLGTGRAESYILPELKRRHRNCWKAAGVLPFTFLNGELRVLLAFSRRQVGRRREGLTLLGGKREKLGSALVTDQSPKATALRELSEETGGLLSTANIDESELRTVLWYPSGGYACYFIEVGPQYWDLPSRYADRLKVGQPRQRSDPLRLRWVPLNTLRSFRRTENCVSFLQLFVKGTPMLQWLDGREALKAAQLLAFPEAEGLAPMPDLLQKPERSIKEVIADHVSGQKGVFKRDRRKGHMSTRGSGMHGGYHREPVPLHFKPYPEKGHRSMRVVTVGPRISEHYEPQNLVKWERNGKLPGPTADLSVALLSASTTFLPLRPPASQPARVTCPSLFPGSTGSFLPREGSSS